MKKLNLADLKKTELEILCHIDKICRENGLTYYLCGGTLLGAVRHKGFIPWDDDIDIMMPRPDYEKLLQLFDGSGRYSVISHNNPDYYYTFAKAVDTGTILHENGLPPIDGMGVYVDIFPIDGMPSDADACKKHFKALHKVRQQIDTYHIPAPKMRKNIFLLLRHAYIYYFRKKSIRLSPLQQKYRDLAFKYPYDSAQTLYITGGAYAQRDIVTKQMLGDKIEFEFEGHSFFAPSGFDKYLTQLYGDYMQLPPKDKQVTHHDFIAEYK